MKKTFHAISLTAFMLLVFQLMKPTLMAQPIPTSNGPIGSILSVSDSGQIKYWNNTAWIAVNPGLSGQNLQFVNGLPIWFDAPVTDVDGNVYDVVTIGTQRWMKQNLNVTHYSNGNSISTAPDPLYWSWMTVGAYCNYNNDVSYSPTYGKLYNYYTTIDPRKLCPTNWHIPSVTEWTTLTNYLGGSNLAGGKLKEIGLAHWTTPNVGATNISGFTGLPGGYRSTNGGYGSLGGYGIWWSNTSTGNSTAWTWSLEYYNTTANTTSYYEYTRGFSVRCIKD